MESQFGLIGELIVLRLLAGEMAMPEQCGLGRTAGKEFMNFNHSGTAIEGEDGCRIRQLAADFAPRSAGDDGTVGANRGAAASSRKCERHLAGGFGEEIRES